MLRRSGALTAIVIATLAGGLLGAAPAPANEGDVLVRGTCTGSSTAKLKLSPEDGRIEVEFEVDQNRDGVPWRVVLTRVGLKVAQLTRVTRGPSGSFTARRVLANRPGGDVVRASASRNGERCSARATFRG
jgi:hypothetical protein